MTTLLTDDANYVGAYLILAETEIPNLVEVGRRYNLEHPRMLVSNQKEADIPVSSKSDTPYVLLLSQNEEGWQFENQGTRGTVKLNGFPSEENQLKDGDWLRVGGTTFQFVAGVGMLSGIYSQLFLAGRIDLHTGAYNKAQFWVSLEDWMNLSKRHKQSLALLMIDIDHFKRVNTDYGHLGGDVVLKQVAERIFKRLRKGDVFCRYGGEEFALILSEAPKDSAISFAEDLRQEIAKEPMIYGKISIPITVSIGVAEFQEGMSKEEFVEIADQRMYVAKDMGRNRVAG